MKEKALLNKWSTLLVAGLAGCVLSLPVKAAVETVASFSILADMVKTVGGDKVTVSSLVPADGDAHEVEMTPQDIKKMSSGNTRLLFVNGLGLDSWTGRLVKSSGFKGKVVVVSNGIPLRKLNDDRS